MQSIRTIFFSSVLPAVLTVTAAYQLLMGLNGPEGLHRASQLQALKAEREAELAALEDARAQLEERADRLLLASLDEDLLDERVRAQLGHMRPGEYRIPASELDEIAALRADSGQELTSLLAVALLEGAGV